MGLSLCSAFQLELCKGPVVAGGVRPLSSWGMCNMQLWLLAVKTLVTL